jgi:hypothetical protein
MDEEKEEILSRILQRLKPKPQTPEQKKSSYRLLIRNLRKRKEQNAG